MISCIKKLHCKNILHLYLKMIHSILGFYVESNENVKKKLDLLSRELKIKFLEQKNRNISTRFGTKFVI